MMYPPIRGPAMGPNMMPMPKMAIAIPCSFGGNVSSRIAWESGWSAPADSLQDAEEDEHPEARGGTAQQGGEGEQEDGEGEIPLPPEGAGEPPRHRDDDGVGDEVGS